MRAVIGLAAGALLLAGTTSAFAQTQGATATLQTPDGRTVANATFTPQSGGVLLRVQANGLPPGPHGIHVHTVGKCEPPDFMSAGGHYNPTSMEHGLENPEGAHAGDMPNMSIGADGSGTFEYLLRNVTTGPGTGTLFGPEGTALVIHAGADDQMTDPSGNSGGRIACGVIRAAAASTAGAAPVAQPTPAAKPAARSQAPAQAPRPAPSPAALPRTGVAPVPFEMAVPAAVTGLGAIAAGLVLLRRRR